MKGIPFMPEMAVAALRERNPKTETRRAINPPPDAGTTALNHFRGAEWHANMPSPDIKGLTLHLGKHRCAYQVGERVCMLATWAVNSELDARRPVELTASSIEVGGFWHAGMGPKPEWAGKSRPGRFLPNAMRHLMPVFEITAVRAERLQAIDEAGAKAEGLSCLTKDQHRTYKYGIPDYDGMPGGDDHGWQWADWKRNPVEAYRHLWESIQGPGSWDLNPWVWVVNFRRV